MQRKFNAEVTAAVGLLRFPGSRRAHTQIDSLVMSGECGLRVRVMGKWATCCPMKRHGGRNTEDVRLGLVWHETAAIPSLGRDEMNSRE